jgi:hypothetical protein
MFSCIYDQNCLLYSNVACEDLILFYQLELYSNANTALQYILCEAYKFPSTNIILLQGNVLIVEAGLIRLSPSSDSE